MHTQTAPNIRTGSPLTYKLYLAKNIHDTQTDEDGI